MSFDAIPTAVLVHVLARFFVFEGTVDPARSQQCTDGHRLLQLRKFSATETTQLKRNMDRIQVEQTIPRRIEYGSTNNAWFASICDSNGTHLSWSLVGRNELPGTLVRVWDEETRTFQGRAHPILGWNVRIIQRPLRVGKTI